MGNSELPAAKRRTPWEWDATAVRALVKVLGESQERFARLVGAAPRTVRTWLHEGAVPSPAMARALYRVWASMEDWEREVFDTLRARPAEPEEDTTNRSQFLRSAAAVAGMTAIGPVAPLLELTSERIGGEHLDAVGLALRTLERLDAEQGGDQAYPQAVGLIGRVNGWLRDGAYPAHVGDGLRGALGDVEFWAGWLAYDAGQPSTARHHYHEALLSARVIDDQPLETRVLAQMSLVLNSQGQPREAVSLAKTAQRAATGWATPRLKTLLHLRAMLGYATMHDLGGFRREMASARHLFDQGTHEDDPLFIGFLTEAELAGLEAIAYNHLGMWGRAVDLYRGVIHATDAERGRNRLYYTVRLGEVLLSQGDATAAAETGIELIPTAKALGSSRIRQHLGAMRAGMESQAGTPKAQEFTDLYDHAFAQGPDQDRRR